MLDVLGRTNTLSKHLQRKDQDILEAASLVRGTKLALQKFRDDGFGSTLKDVTLFCQKYDIQMVDMTDYYVTSKNRKTKTTNQFHFEVDIFNTVLDMQIVEFGERFSEVTTNLIECMAALSPCNSFSKFDEAKLLNLSEIYKNDFTDSERKLLLGQLNVYYHSVTNEPEFANLKGISDLARVMVETGKYRSYYLVYKLVKLALVLPVATATVERCFSSMKLLKTDLRNKMSDEFLNDALICSVEHELLRDVKTENVISRFQKMKDRRDSICDFGKKQTPNLAILFISLIDTLVEAGGFAGETTVVAGAFTVGRRRQSWSPEPSKSAVIVEQKGEVAVGRGGRTEKSVCSDRRK
ncbi:hypothetical protein L2E82_27776 [Cichorium intybus]|uniref:Uncharacterized protein n=1 Tax=Cichorium intybus TaxID=13427 RepID=A0ACB9CTY6_CICIN|nr:hypothetical protein L2E82_27776 [Cichorium intybus]